MSKQVEQIRDQIEARFWGAGQPLFGEEVTEQARQLLDFIDALPKEDGPKKPEEEICSRCAYYHKGDDMCHYPYGGLSSYINENGVYKCDGFEPTKEVPADVQGAAKPTCKTCRYYENDCPQIRGKFAPYPSRVCKDYSDTMAQAQPVPADVPEAAKKYADEQLLGHNRELAESGHTRHFKMGYVCFAGYEIEAAFADGMLAERERLMKEAVEGEIVKDIFGKLGATAKVNLDGFKFGEKVRVIIIKSK